MGWYTKLQNFNVLAVEFDIAKLFQRKRVIGPPRSIYLNSPLPQTDEYFDHKGRPRKDRTYPTNQVITSKYTIITFFPRNLLEQFRRVANVFFLAIAILQFFSKFSTISPGLVILPLIIIIFITALKDGYEDIKRHQSDRQVNHSKVRVLAGGDPEWVNPNMMQGKERTFTRGVAARLPGVGSKKNKTKAKDNKKGANTDVAHQQEGEPIQIPQTPAIEYDDEDVHSSHGGLFTTSHHPSRPHWKKTLWEDLRVGDFVKIHDDEPFPADILICSTSEDENVCFVETKNLDGETNLKSRNGVPGLTGLRSARECVERVRGRVDLDRPDTNMYRLNGAVVFEDGEKDGEKERKVPIDLQMTLLRGTVLRNTRWVIGIVLFTGSDAKIVLNSGGTPSKRSRVERQMNPQVFLNLALLGVMATACAIADSVLEHREFPEGAPWLFDDDRSDDNPRINGLVTWVFALITFQNIIPISLYLSMEFVKTIQALWIYFDYDMYYEPTDKPTLARSWNLSDDLGQIEYVFSDKTGTLTQNQMVFRECSVGGKVYKGEGGGGGGVGGEGDEGSEKTTEDVVKPAKEPVEVRLSGAGSSSSDTANKEVTQLPDPAEASATKLPEKVLAPRFRNAALEKDLEEAVSDNPNAPHARALNGFFTVLSLCHTVLTSVDPDSGAIEYKAQSPDEEALVQAAADVGYVFRGRERETLLLQTPFSGEEVERYELLNILEFTSARKRMSVVLRKEGEDGRLFLLCKGADNVVFERLKEGIDEGLKGATEGDLDAFAGDGLRTLTLAYKVVPEEEYRAWSERYHEATVAIEGREEEIERVSEEIERDLRLLGATAIEDKLQDGVPETIADLKRAGIKVWVATGDKLETAIAIGYTTNLIEKSSNIIIVKGGGEGSVPVYSQMIRACEDFFPDSGILEDARVEKSEESMGMGGTGLRRTATGVSSIVGEGNGERPGGFVLVIDGAALTHALQDEQHKYLLLQLATHCDGVICCRVSPLQKALVVKLVKDGLGAMCLAIGDGANDVSMIQAADVGVGISGEEGLQAVNSSDYAIAQFRFLKKLLLVHGHWSYARNGNTISNFFYKNIVSIGVLWWFQIYDGWSSAYAFDYTYLLFWNAFWTIAPVIAIGLFDRIVDADVLMALPELYHFGREGHWFGIKTFLYFMFDGVVQSAIIFFVINFAYFSPSARSDGYAVGQFEYSTTMVISAVMVANLYNGMNTNNWTGWVFFAVFLGIVLVWAFTLFYSAVSPGWFVTDVFGNNHFLFRSAYFWLCLPITVLLSLLPRYLYLAVKFDYFPDDIDIMRYVSKEMRGVDIAKEAHVDNGLAALRRSRSRSRRSRPSFSRHASRRSSRSSRAAPSRANDSLGDISLDARVHRAESRIGSRTDMSTGMQSVHRGFDFSTEENGVAMRRMQSNLSERRHSSRNLAIPGADELHKPSIFNLGASLRRKKAGQSKGSHG